MITHCLKVLLSTLKYDILLRGAVITSLKYDNPFSGGVLINTLKYDYPLFRGVLISTLKYDNPLFRGGY